MPKYGPGGERCCKAKYESRIFVGMGRFPVASKTGQDLGVLPDKRPSIFHKDGRSQGKA